MKYCFPFDKVPYRAKIIIYGGGRVGQDYLQMIVEKDYCKVLMVVDCRANNINLHGVEVCFPQEVFSVDYDYIVIANKDLRQAREIKEWLQENGAHDIVCEDIRCVGIDTFSQHGEDLIVHVIFRMMGMRYPSYIDVGAHHPFSGSNTALLYQMGSRGVNIEPNPNLIDNFMYYRKYDINLNVGITPDGGTKKFFMFAPHNECNTFSEEEINYVLNKKTNWEIYNHIDVQTLTLDEIVSEYCDSKWPDFLDIDIEGLDFEVLKNAKINVNGPKLVLAEVREMQLDNFNSMMHEKGYEQYMRLWTNNFYIRSDFMKYVARKNIMDDNLYIEDY